MGIDKLRAITYFLRTAEAGSFAAAARSLDVTASALSKALTALEGDIGFNLFSRSTRKLSLTEDGEAYRECCREVLQDLEGVELAARSSLVGARGTLRFGVHPAVRSALLRQLPRFLRDHAGLKLDMVSTNDPSSLLEQGLDVVFCIGRLPDSGLVALPLGWAEFVICGSPAYLAAHGVPQHPDDLSAHDAIVYTRPDEDSGVRWPMRRGEERRVVAPPVRLAVRDGAGLIDAARHGCGLARPYEIAARLALQSGQLRAVLGDWESERQPLFAVVAKSKRLPAKVRAFIEFARTVV